MAQTLRDTLDQTTSTLRMLGTANATGALAAGAAFQSFAAHPEIQMSIKIALLAYLFGIVLFALSYVILLDASIEADFFTMASEERVKWEEIFWLLKKNPGVYAKSAKRAFSAALLFGGASAACFLGGLLYTITLVIRF
ncbi:MAG: hypothetical protein WB760_26195 [Xanthobacteraceae bacterium]